MPSSGTWMIEFDPHCRRCTRLAEFLEEGRARHPAYHCAPVAPFGDATPRLLIVGLAPGFHGANASGRPFTGDYAGVLLYETLHRFGWASAAVSTSRDDGLRLVEWPQRAPGLSEAADLRIRLAYAGAGRSAEIAALSDKGQELLTRLVTTAT